LVILYAGRRHFEDTRYSGGANSLPVFEGITLNRGRPPLLETDFDVWHIRAGRRDMYFMPDHILVYEGARVGGVAYSKLALSSGTEVIQAREIAKQTPDCKTVGSTYRFVNNDGSPDQRFNNNTVVPLVEYGIAIKKPLLPPRRDSSVCSVYPRCPLRRLYASSQAHRKQRLQTRSKP
jgi:hypothetical protein